MGAISGQEPARSAGLNSAEISQRAAPHPPASPSQTISPFVFFSLVVMTQSYCRFRQDVAFLQEHYEREAVTTP